MSHAQQMNMGGPVVQQVNAGTPNSSGVGMTNEDYIRRLNTAIYDYMLRNQLYDAARLFVNKMEVETDIKRSPNQRGGQQVNGVDDGMDTDDKELQARPADLPMPNKLGDGPFLQDWWCQFWELYQGHRGKGNPRQNTLNYIGTQRQAQKARTNVANMDPSMQNMRGYNNMMQNMNNGMGMPADLKRTALQNQRNMTPQQLAQMKNMQAAQQNSHMAQANQMERQGSHMDMKMEMNGQRSSSPGSGDAPSPKRQRLDGNLQNINQGRPGPGQMQGNNPAVETYSASMQQTVKAAMNQANSNMNKGLPPNAVMGPVGQQGSPMSQVGLDGASGEFYAAANGARLPNGPGNAAAAAQGNGGPAGNHALQDYQMQLMLLEQQNKKRLLMARQEQDLVTHPNAPVGQNGQYLPNTSPQSRAGDPSPNPNDMQRGTPKINKVGGSPNGDMAGRGSPQPGMVSSSMIPADLRSHIMANNQMMANGQMGNGQMMRPPSSHPISGGGAALTPEQMRMFTNQQQGQPMMPNGGWQPGQPGPMGQPGQPLGQMMGQGPGQAGPGQAAPNMTPRPGNQMPPPPPPVQANTQPSSPSQQAAAPPTPVQPNKAKPGKKEPNKKAAAKKGTNATPASESEQPPTPTPQTPITPMNPNTFSGQKHNAQMPNGQPPSMQQNTQINQPPPNAMQQPPPMSSMDGAPLGSLTDADQFSGMNLEFAGMESGDVLDNFDFDSFLNTGDAGDGLGFDANFAFGDGTLEAGADMGV